MPFLNKVQPGGKQKAVTPDRALTPSVVRTLATFAQHREPVVDEGVAKIEVHDTVSNVAWAYEKLRQAIDYQDEHLLRKNAIERILKRRLVAGATADAIAEPLILELIRGRYLLNNELPVTVIADVAEVINRYIHLWTRVPTVHDHDQADQLFAWYVGLLSVEVNEVLSPSDLDEALVQLMFDVTKRDITFVEDEVSEVEKDTQIYIAIQRTLLKSDPEMIRYHLFLRLHPEWLDATVDQITAIGQQFAALHDTIEAQLLHPAGELLQRVMKKYTIIFLVFNDIVEKYKASAQTELVHPDQVVDDVKAAYSARRKKILGKITRSFIRSFAYILLTKMVLVLILEVPINRLLFHTATIDRFPLLVSVLVPPMLLVVLGVTIRPPGKKNEDAVVEKVQNLLYRGDERHALVKPRKPIRRSSVFTYFYRILYALIFIIVFGGLISVLTTFHFTPFDQFIFILFLTLVSFFGIRIRNLSKELLVVDQREDVFNVIFDFFTVPILQVGRWISLRAPKINLLIFFLDVIIEAPFKAFLEATEGFFGFLREKREEIY